MDENQNIEYKESWRDEYLKWICGFANAKGGKIYIGKEDAAPHRTVRLDDVDKLMEDIPNKVRDVLGIMVDTNLLYENDLKYIEIIVEPQPYGVSYKGQFHYRSGSTKQELKGTALNKFLLERRGLQWDQVPVPGVTPADLDQESLRTFRKKAIDSNRIDADVLNDTDEILLENLNLIRDGMLTRAALLMFHPKPEKFFSNAFVKIGFFLSDDELMFQDEIHGSIMGQLEKAYDLIKTKYMTYAISYKGLDRKERAPFPEESLREALLNALAHKSYAEPYPIQISIYPDHFVIWNAGELPEGWTIDILRSKHPSMAFNPDIANALFRCGEIEAWGRGIKKIMDKSIEYKILPPIFDTSFGGLMITFYSSPVVQMKQDGFDSRSASIVGLAFENGRVTNQDVQKLLDVSRATAFRMLSKLSKYLSQVGDTGKNTYYVIKGFTNASKKKE